MKVSALGVKSLVVSCVGFALGAMNSVFAVTNTSFSSPAPERSTKSITQKHNSPHSQELSLAMDSKKTTTVEGEKCVILLNCKILPEPDPELKSSSSSGYPPDPSSSRYRSSVVDGDFAAVTNIYRGEIVQISTNSLINICPET